MERLFAKHRVKPRIVMELPSNETIKQAVMAGMGLSFLSLRTVRHELASGHLVLLDIEGLPLMKHWYVTHLASKRLSPRGNRVQSVPARGSGCVGRGVGVVCTPLAAPLPACSGGRVCYTNGCP